jgi:oligopeptidase A
LCRTFSLPSVLAPGGATWQSAGIPEPKNIDTMEHPFLDPSLPIRWSRLTPDHVEPDITEALRRAEANLEAIRSLPPRAEDLTFESTFLALEEATRELSTAWGLVQHLDAVCNSPALREANNKMLPAVSSFYARIPLDPKLWAVLRAYGESPEVEILTQLQQRFVKETMEDFRESGADLPGDKRARLEALEGELAELTQKYSENVLDATNAWELVIDDESRLEGLPPSAREAAAASAKSKGLGTPEKPAWRFTLHMPSYGPLMEHLKDASIREQAWRAMTEVARKEPWDNSELVWKILALREEKARLLGKENFADLVLKRRMAKDGNTALRFVESLHDRIESAFAREQDELAEWRAKQLGVAPEPMEPWDMGYWAEKRRKADFDLDDEQMRPYFPMDGVISGMFSICELLFGIRIEEIPVHAGAGEAPDGLIEVWHPEVKAFRVLDEDGSELGGFYTDWHPRESKRGGAWMNSLRTGLPPVDGRPREPHVGLMCGNMTPPVEGKPALLTHNEVETVFHEFGHLLHHLLGDVPLRSLNGISVPWDFVELPSQIMENFCWDRRSLDFFARHHESGEPIPDELFSRVMAARNYMSASIFMRQMALGKMDLELHVNYTNHRDGDLDEVCTRVLEGYTAETRTPVPPNVRRFGHLFSSPVGYAAGYYSYKWAEVLDADAFTRFAAAGVLDAATGREFRRTILGAGGSKDAADLYRDFMGRDPDPEPLLVRAGLA